MSTRGTYTFKSEFTTVTLYVHHDNSPEGAAVKFHDMLIEQESSTAEAFLRANTRAEIVSNDMMMGQEYHYEINANGTMKAFPVSIETDELGECFFSGSVYEFINKYGKEFELEEWFQIDQPGKYARGQKWTSKTHLKNWITATTERLAELAVYCEIDNVNIKGAKETLDYLSNAYMDRFGVNKFQLNAELKKAA